MSPTLPHKKKRETVMGRVDFDKKNRVQTTNFDFPKLKLKNGERARIYILESPVVEYVHELRKPKIIDGVPKMGTAKRKDGTEYQDYIRDFVGSPLCLGREEVLDEKGSDPQECPICAYAKDFPDRMKAPKRRYAMHVLRYKTASGGFKPLAPFSAELLVWAFSSTVFNKIIDFNEEWAEAGGLKKHDLSLGPCENEGFQKFDIGVLPDVAWAGDPAKKKMVEEIYKGQQIPDLSIACGSRKERRWIDIDLDSIKEAWEIIDASDATPGKTGAVAASAGAAAAVDDGTSLTDGLSSLLDSDEAVAEKPSEAAPAASGSADDIDSLLPDTEASEAAPEPSKDEPTEEEKPKADDFDDLLAGLDIS